MQHRHLSLEQFHVATPCTMSWEGMPGDEQKRFCAHCNKHVYRPRAMTREAAEALICNPDQHVCAVLEYDDAGKVLTLDYAPRHTKSPRRWFWPITAISTAVTALFATLSCSSRTPLPPPSRAPGDIAPINATVGMIAQPSSTPTTSSTQHTAP